MVAIIRKYKAPIQNIFVKISRLLLIELHQLMAAYITERVPEELLTVQDDHLLLQIYRPRSILDQRIQQVRRHSLVRIPIPRPVSQPPKCKLLFRDNAHNGLTRATITFDGNVIFLKLPILSLIPSFSA